jgi:hypothetical protein
MGIFGRSKPPVIVAAAEGVDVANFVETQALTLTRQTWQLRAWGYYDEVGEIHFAARYVGNALSKIRLVGAERPTSQHDAPKETSNKVVREAVENLKSPNGGQSNLMRMLGLNIFVAGECFLIGQKLDDGRQSWEAVSINELEIRAGQRVPLRRRNPVETPRPLEKGTLVVRVWQQHPRYSGLADSSMRTVLDECEKLLLLTRADKAAARSRFAGAGLLFIPNELMPVVQQPSGTGANNVDPATNPLYQNLVESMITPIRDEQHPSGVVPITVFGPAEFGSKIQYFTFDRPQAARATQQREEAITRIATAIDLPPEVLTGKADLNHWTSWQIHEETFQAHLQPYVELICDAITVGYLHPALQKADVADWEKYRVWYDDSELVVRPNKSDTAGALHEAIVISDAAYRRETGFDEDDAPSEEERAKRVGLVLQDEKLALTGEMTEQPAPGAPGGPSTPEHPGKGGDSPTLADKTGRNQETVDAREHPTGTPPKPQQPVTASAARRRAKPVGPQLAAIDVELMTQLRTAASEVLVRELDRAGARIRSKAAGDVNVKDVLRDTPNHLVASVLGPTLVASLDLGDHELLAGAFSSFGARAAVLIAAAQSARNRVLERFLRARGSETPSLDSIYGSRDKANKDTSIGLLIAGLLTLAARKLYDPAPDAATPGRSGENDGLLVPGSLVREVVSAAGGSVTSAPGDLVEPEDFGGVGTGGTTTAIFADNGVRVLQRQWVYGPAIRRPFESHEVLDGLVFSSWDDASLTVQPSDGWLNTEYYHPGDHTGCLCAVAPILDVDLES